MEGEALRLRLTDIEQFRQQLTGWDTLPVQLGAGCLHIDWDSIDLGGQLILSRLALDRKLTDVSAINEGTLVFVVCLGAKTWCGNEVEPGSLVILGPGRDHRNVLEPRWMSIEICVSIEEMVGEGLAADTLLTGERSLRVYPLPSDLLLQYRQLVDFVFRADARLSRPTPIELLAIRATVLELILRTGAHIEAPGFEPPRLRRRNGYRLAAAAMDLIERNADHLFGVGDLASSLRVSERALNYAFRQALGLSTYRYMLACRLNAANRELKASSGRHITVTEAAMNSDFYHLGRFALHYRNMFGELPSQTLANRAPGLPM
ncbi:hypothetical protein MesoLjLb_43420 [Mesorhizobium sp. L-8-3]|nr:hypothetical protein MesoLjLb_43420 [Mesorhizobium sp. L-8-3]